MRTQCNPDPNPNSNPISFLHLLYSTGRVDEHNKDLMSNLSREFVSWGFYFQRLVLALAQRFVTHFGIEKNSMRVSDA